MTEPVDDLIAVHLPAIWRLARVLTGSSSESEDLVQNTFLAAWQRRDSLRDPRAARAWLLQIAVNEHRDAHRRRAARQRSHLRAAADPTSIVGRTTSSGADTSRPEASELERMAAAAMAALPDRQREVLHLSAVEGLDHATIGEILGITPGNVGSTLAIARRKLAATLSLARPAGTTSRTTEESTR